MINSWADLRASAPSHVAAFSFSYHPDVTDEIVARRNDCVWSVNRSFGTLQEKKASPNAMIAWMAPQRRGFLEHWLHPGYR